MSVRRRPRFRLREQVAGADADVLQSLLDKSPPGRREDVCPRFWMLETIREFAAEQLGAAGKSMTQAPPH